VKHWPWPGDNLTDAARRVAWAYRAVLKEVTSDDPGLVEALDKHWQSLGANWIAPSSIPRREDDWLTADEMAELFNVTAKSVYDLGRRGRIPSQILCGERKYNVGDMMEYEYQRRRKATRRG
jgi:hypothetical protein